MQGAFFLAMTKRSLTWEGNDISSNARLLPQQSHVILNTLANRK